jgi:hypothetical protein
MGKKKRFFASHAKSSALMVSLVLHGVLAIAALTFVAVRVVIKSEQTFEVKEVKRPRMKLRKLQVPVKEQKKTQAPKLRKTIVSKPKLKNVDIKMPEIVGVKGGAGYGQAGGLGGLGFDFEMDLFGGNKRGSGNEFLGHFYDLKQTKDGRRTEIGELLAKAKSTDWETDPDLIQASQLYREIVQRFLSGWDAGRLKSYFMAPREKFSTTFIIPQIGAEAAPKAFGVEDQVKPMKWLAVYQGQIAAPETGKYRFCGRGDDVLAVRVKKDLVLDASYMNASGWQSSDPYSSKYEMYGSDSPFIKGMVIGDWFHLQKGRPVEMEVLIGEDPGGMFFCQLYIEQEGVTYPTHTETYTDDDTQQTETLQRPILPVFKTADLPEKVVNKMRINANWATLEGPNFGVVE